MRHSKAAMQRRLHVVVLGFLLIIFFLHAAAADDAQQLVYQGFAGSNILLDGDAAVLPDGLLRLTNGSSQLKGHAFHPTPLPFRQPGGDRVQSFSTAFVFGIISEYLDLSGHGIVFFVSPTTDFSSALPSQYLGLLNATDRGNASNHIFAVELDTIYSSEFDDINDNHVGIDVNDLRSTQSRAAGYFDDGTGQFTNLSLISRKAMQVWIDYNADAIQVNVTMAPVEVAKPKRPLLSAAVNLSTVITDTAYIGFSSSTGSVDSRHYVTGWSFQLGGIDPPVLDLTKLPALPVIKSDSPSILLEVVLPIGAAAFVITVVAIVFVLVRRRLRFAELREDWEVEFGPHRFVYKDLYRATGGFTDKKLLGAGGFGRVYRGVLPSSGVEVAVKRVSHNSRQGIREFVAEVVSIGRMRHRNLVPLLGYCRRKGELLLVYDYMQNGSLDKCLYGIDGGSNLDWALRYRIIKGVAAGLLYLHEDWEQVVVHRDVKASNVLLDAEMNARLGDFGLARLYDHGTDPQTTHVVGTMGYLAPELARSGRATPLTDVFSFGAFVLEVACGRRPVEQDEAGERTILVDVVLESWRSGAVLEVIDVGLRGDYAEEEAELVLKLGLLCSHPLSAVRPSMRQVVRYLEGELPLPEMSPSVMDFSILTLLQNEGFDSVKLASLSGSSTSAQSVLTHLTGLTGGR